VAYDGNRLIGLDCQVKVTKDSLSAGRISEPDVFEFNSSMGNVLYSSLFGINLRWFLNDAENQLG